MELTPELLDAYLTLLKEQDVEEFEMEGFRVKFHSPNPALRTVTMPVPAHYKDERPVTPTSQDLWTNEKLWPGGQPPSFHKKDK